MFAYLLILAELTILASVYWFVFIREPKPLEIRENIWGCYDSGNATTGYGNGTGYSINPFDSAANALNGKRARRVRRAVGHVLLRSSKHGVKRKDVRGYELNQTWTDEQGKRPSVLGAVLAFLGEKLTKLSAAL